MNGGSFVQQYQASIVRGVPTRDCDVRMRDLIDIVFVQLALAPATLNLAETAAEKWAILIRDSWRYEEDKEIPNEFSTGPYMRALDRARYDSMNYTEMSAVQKEEHNDRKDGASWAWAQEQLHDALRRADKAVDEAKAHARKPQQ